ncbi:conserved protein of unknown function [Rhodovastum atsumiense]|uniref:Uncharacterized protein n=1 Tax=Rhodovastum atsumiense TaxID=504468 RepID=A0A5M6IUD8_9PROT|nr:hypothetical protein [Rhodovastum atsumiense]KAA5611930.1 hypothetical protein F1189_11745 [Rhodovastum atsumiense]CAH2598694.1 conserved protein of unknown function [Rhodovastum atsumiense]
MATGSDPATDALWNARRAEIMRLLLQAGAKLAGRGAEVSQSNGWIFRAALGEFCVDATLNEPQFRWQAPDTLTVMPRAFRGGFHPLDRPAALRPAGVAFEPGTARLSEAGRATLGRVAAWLIDAMLEGPPAASAGTRDGASRPPRKPRGPNRTAWAARAAFRQGDARRGPDRRPG